MMKKTFKMLSNGDTLGVFQLESPGMKNLFRKLKPSSIEDIGAANALCRPGPMSQIPPLYCSKISSRKSGIPT